MSSLINGLDEMPGFELLQLSCVCRIGDGALRYRHVAPKDETCETLAV